MPGARRLLGLQGLLWGAEWLVPIILTGAPIVIWRSTIRLSEQQCKLSSLQTAPMRNELRRLLLQQRSVPLPGTAGSVERASGSAIPALPPGPGRRLRGLPLHSCHCDQSYSALGTQSPSVPTDWQLAEAPVLPPTAR